MLERIPPEVRRKTGWLLPVGVSTGLGIYLPGDGELIGRSDQYWLAGLGLAGIAVGVLWQWFSPRELAPRLVFAAAAFVLVVIFTFLPIGDEMRMDNRQLFLGLGVISGLVIANWWHWLRTADDED